MAFRWRYAHWYDNWRWFTKEGRRNYRAAKSLNDDPEFRAALKDREGE